MTLKFEPHGSVAIDRQYGIEIYSPRIEPGNSPNEIEYQYRIAINGRSDGVALFASTSFERSGITAENLTLLSLSLDLQWLLEVKREIACADDNYTFIAEFARGLLLVFGSHSALYTSFHYVMSASEEALMKWGVHASAGAQRDSKGSIVLAEVYVPRRSDADAEARLNDPMPNRRTL